MEIIPTIFGADKMKTNDEIRNKILLGGGHWQENGGNPYNPESPYYYQWERDHPYSQTNIMKRVLCGRKR